MAYSLWVPQAIKIVRATGFPEGRPVDRTRSLNTHRDLSSNLFLDDDVTLLDVNIGGGNSSVSTFVVTTTPESKDTVVNILKDNYIGGPVLGLGSLRVEGVLCKAQDYNTRHPLEVTPIWPRPLFYVEALSSEEELPPVAERAMQQLRMASCCAHNSDTASADLVDNGLLTPEEHVMTNMLGGYASVLVNTDFLRTRSIRSYEYAYVNYWDSVALSVNRALSREWVFTPGKLQSAVSEMCELPVDRVLALVKKSVRKALRDPKYKAPRKHRIRDDKAALELVLSLPLEEYTSRSSDLLLGVKLVTAWLSGDGLSDDDGYRLLGIFAREESDYSYVLDNFYKALSALYLSVPDKPNDVVARFIVDKFITESRVALSARGFNLSKSTGVETFKRAATLGGMLPQDVKDIMQGHMENLMSDVALACKDVLDGGNGSISNITSVLRSAKQCGLLK